MDATARLGGANYVFWCAVAPDARQQPLSVQVRLWALSGMPGCRMRPSPWPVGNEALSVCLIIRNWPHFVCAKHMYPSRNIGRQ